MQKNVLKTKNTCGFKCPSIVLLEIKLAAMHTKDLEQTTINIVFFFILTITFLYLKSGKN